MMVNKQDRKKLAERIRNKFRILLAEKETRDGKTISYRDVQRETGIDASTLSDWANNAVKRYDADKLAALCEYFGCGVGDLIEYSPPPQKAKKKSE